MSKSMPLSARVLAAAALVLATAGASALASDNHKFFVAEQSTLYVQQFPGGVAMNLAEPGKPYRMHVFSDRYRPVLDETWRCRPGCRVPIAGQVAHAFASNSTAWKLGAEAGHLTVQVTDPSVHVMNVVVLLASGERLDYTFLAGEASPPQSAAPAPVQFSTAGREADGRTPSGPTFIAAVDDDEDDEDDEVPVLDERDRHGRPPPPVTKPSGFFSFLR